MDEPVRLSTRADGTLRIALRGELGFTNVDALRKPISDAVRRARPALVLIDLSEVTFLDSSGLGMLLAVRREADRNGGGCLVERGNDLVLSRLDLAGLAHVFGLRAAVRRRRYGRDAGRADAGRADAGRADAGRADAGRADAGRADAGRADAR